MEGYEEPKAAVKVSTMMRNEELRKAKLAIAVLSLIYRAGREPGQGWG